MCFENSNYYVSQKVLLHLQLEDFFQILKRLYGRSITVFLSFVFFVEKKFVPTVLKAI